MAATSNTIEVFVHTIADCLNEIIVNEHLDEALQNTLGRLSASIQVDCCHVYCHGNPAISRGFGTANLVVQPQPLKMLPAEILSLLVANRCVKLSINNQMSAAVQHFFALHGLQSLLFVPVFKNDNFWGAIGFGDAKQSRTWYNTEVPLQSLATAMAAAIQAEYTKNKNIAGSINYYAATAYNKAQLLANLETERKFRFISENISDFISIHDPDWNFTYASPSVKNVLGYEPADIIGMACFDLIHPDDLTGAIESALKPLVIGRKETQCRFRMRSNDGCYLWVETYSKPVVNSKGEVASLISSTRNVSEQVEAELRLKESEEKYRLLSENSNDVIAIHQVDGAFQYISPSCYQVLGYHQNELLEKHPANLLAAGQFRAAFAAFAKVLQGCSERRFICKISTRPATEKLLEVWLKPVIKQGVLVAVQSASRDVTEREQLLKDLQLSLAKERELGELRKNFVSTASHQFRTPLTVIQSGVEIMNMYLDGLPEEKQAKFKKQIATIAGEVERLEYLMNHVLSLERSNADRTPFNPRKLDVVGFCSNLVDNYNIRFEANRKIQFKVLGTKVPLYVDDKLLGHALDNIITNAYKYSKAYLQFKIKFSANRVIITVADKGIGIPEADLQNLFQPFYRATNTGDFAGTGLGLSIAKEFIEKNGGKIIIDSKLNKGTAVSVILSTH